MSNQNPLFKRPKRHHGADLEDSWHNLSGQEEVVKLINFEDLIPNDNPYPIVDLDELIENIKLHGLDTSLLVQETDNRKYVIIGGHRRYHAIKSILESDEADEYEELTQVYCKVIDANVDPLIVRLRLHDNNLQTRPLLKLAEDEKLAIIEDYMNVLDEAREKGFTINGKPIKGKTRDLIASRFNISTGSAQKLMAEVKGANFVTQEDNAEEYIDPSEKQYKDILKKVKALEKSIDKADSLSTEQLDTIVGEIQSLLFLL